MSATSDKRNMRITSVLLVLLACLALPLWGCGQQQQVPTTTESASTQESAQEGGSGDGETAQEQTLLADFQDPGDGYALKQVVVLSRHNIRAPMSGKGSVLDLATPHTWITWTANTSELTSRGGGLETMTGQYVRKWLEHEGLAPENWRPEDGEVRFYANGKQRTQATAQYFSSGMLPVANVDIEVHAEYDTMDPTFNPQITFMSDAYQEAALKQIAQMGGDAGMAGIGADLADSYELIEQVLDYRESEAYKAGDIKDLDTTDTSVTLEIGKEPTMNGSLKTACSLSDALVLQYYETEDAKAAAFGHGLIDDQWKLISKSKDTYGRVLFTAPLIAANVAHPLLQEIGNEMDAQGRLFTFLCGHDSNIGSVLAALDVEEYELPGAIEADTPIGCKVLFERWEDEAGASYGRVRLMYQSVDQLRSGSMLGGYETPQVTELGLAGLQKNADGLYAYDDLRARVADATAEYDRIVAEYGEQELAEAA